MILRQIVFVNGINLLPDCDGDCGRGKFCFPSVNVTGGDELVWLCADQLDNGESCLADNWCKSGYCWGTFNKTAGANLTDAKPESRLSGIESKQCQKSGPLASGNALSSNQDQSLIATTAAAESNSILHELAELIANQQVIEAQKGGDTVDMISKLLDILAKSIGVGK